MFTCIVNSVGPVSGQLLQEWLLIRDPRDVAGTLPIIGLVLTDLNGAFQSQNFVVDGTVNNWVLAVALAAVNTGFQVSADIDWPPLGPDDHGNPQPDMCRALLINSA